MSRPLKVMLVAVEASADTLGAGLARALKARLGEDGVSFIGVGGARMAQEGIESLFGIDDLSLVGAVEIIGAIPRAIARIGQAVRFGVEQQPDVAVLIDSWVASYWVGRGLKRRAPKMALIKYAAPQVWATRPSRAKALARSVDHLMTLFGFEAPYFERWGLATTFVGSPTLSADFSDADTAALRTEIRRGGGRSHPARAARQPAQRDQAAHAGVRGRGDAAERWAAAAARRRAGRRHGGRAGDEPGGGLAPPRPRRPGRGGAPRGNAGGDRSHRQERHRHHRARHGRLPDRGRLQGEPAHRADRARHHPGEAPHPLQHRRRRGRCAGVHPGRLHRGQARSGSPPPAR